MMNIAIIDDCVEERDTLLRFVEEYYSSMPIYKQITPYSSGESFLKDWEPGAFDLVFLDIYMEGIDGINVAEQIRDKDEACLLIFTTSSKEHAIKSYRLRAFDYLLKPLDYELFSESMRLCDRELRKRNHYIQVKASRTLVKIRINDIIFTDYFNHYIQIHTTERIIRSYMKFDEFSSMLLCYSQFLSCYRNCIVNMDHIAQLSKNDVVLKNGEHIPITRSKRQWIQQQYTDYQFCRLTELNC